MMDQRVDIPCQVCLVISTKGEIRPLWCRYQTEQGELIKINIDEVKQTGNIGKLFFESTSYGEERKSMFVLMMDNRTFKWKIIRILL